MREVKKFPSPVPSGRLERLAHLGGLAGRLAGGMLAEGIRQVAGGKLPRPAELLLTPGNARRLADKLAELRGAAMKVGQLLSLDAGDLLPADLAAILSQLRADARPLPAKQIMASMRRAFGDDWERGFRSFRFDPVAAASIGQVHRAVAADGRTLAIKIQYPGIRRSIDSDVDNVAALLKVSRLLPRDIDLQPLLEEAKQQLHAEADYLREAQHLQRFADLLAADTALVVPRVDRAHTCETILSMEFLDGVPVDTLLHAAPTVRNQVIHRLLDLLFRELFDFGLIQTDPNFANYLYDASTGRLGLLDFGATRDYGPGVSRAYRELLAAALGNDRPRVAASAGAIGYFRDGVHARQRDAVIDLFMLATEPARRQGHYDFGRSDLAARIRDAGMRLSFEQGYWHTPPADALFLHRKLGGLYLLASRLQARVDVHAILERHLADCPDPGTAEAGEDHVPDTRRQSAALRG